MAVPRFVELEAELERRVAMKDHFDPPKGDDPGELKRLQREAGQARADWFIAATQGKGKPLSKQSHGTGKKPGEK